MINPYNYEPSIKQAPTPSYPGKLPQKPGSNNHERGNSHPSKVLKF